MTDEPVYSPEYLKRAHAATWKNEQQIRASSVCTCLFCGWRMHPGSGTDEPDWIEEGEGQALTAACPKCFVDCIIGEASGYPVEKQEFIEQFSRYCFNGYSLISSGQDLLKSPPRQIDVD